MSRQLGKPNFCFLVALFNFCHEHYLNSEKLTRKNKLFEIVYNSLISLCSHLISHPNLFFIGYLTLNQYFFCS